MTSETRRELLQVLADLSEACPDVRLGQLVTNLSYLASGPSNSAAWDVEDEQLLQAARDHLNEWRTRQSATAKAG